MEETTGVTVAQLDSLVEEMRQHRIAIEKKNIELTAMNKIAASMEGKIVQYLKELGRTKYETPHGTVSIRGSWRVNLPEKGQAMGDFFDYLKSQGIFEAMATVNSASLNSLYMKEWEGAKKRGEGMTFTMPGVPAPTFFEKMSFRKGKEQSDES